MNTAAFPRPISWRRKWPWIIDVFTFLAVFAVFYGILRIGRTWLGPVPAPQQISQSPQSLPLYAAESLFRIAISYILSLVFAVAYGYAAARWKRAERILIPLLDILQSIPVLSFLPGVMLAMVALFPNRRIGVEFGSILLIFTGQAWNIAFSFYSSMKTIPRELSDASRLYRFNPWQRFTELDLPFAAIGLVWNSMVSVASAWFYLMACEMFVLGQRDFRLPGLGSFLQTAAGAGNIHALLWGVAAMIAVIVAIDQLLWRPVIAWSDKFKMEQVEGAATHGSAVLDFLRRSGFAAFFYRRIVHPLSNLLERLFARARTPVLPLLTSARPSQTWLWRTGLAVAVVALGYVSVHAAHLLATLTRDDLGELARGASFTFLRVHASLIIGALWTIPAGVAIGSSPRLARIFQPLVQIAASVPATALFPVVLMVLIRFGGGMGIAAMLLMLLGTQWYILFNVIAGAMAIPTDLKEAAGIFRFTPWERWRRLILPGIFPYLVTGMLTASGGAWNASILAEYFRFGGQTLYVNGLGAIISRASDAGHYDVLLASTILMAAIVVTMNRLVWRRLYRLAETRFKLEI
jgi:NitT/TauT family transport system permease protein